ncbi:MAG: DegV family protein [Eubacteriales bacterium]|nr:DegV family protein [Eubacteriales bacterium]
MKKTGIVTDSHSSISQELAANMGILVLPMPFYINGRTCLEGIDLSREEFFRLQREGADISTSSPSPADVMDIWDRALSEYEEIVYIPISSGLSGSYSAAEMLSREEPYEGRVFVVDNGRVSTPMHVTVLDAMEMIEKGKNAAEIKEILEKFRAEQVIYVAIDNIEYLKKGGRVSPAAAAIATVLNIKPVVKFDVGSLDVYKKCRGMQAAEKEMFKALKNDLMTRFKDWYEKGDYYLMTATAVLKDANDAFVERVKAEFPGVPVYSDYLSLGTSCHIGYGGMGVAVSCKPRY